MDKAVEAIGRELSGVRTGKATTTILDVVKVEYYGTLTPLKQVASVSAPDPKLLVIQPWEKNIVGDGASQEAIPPGREVRAPRSAERLGRTRGAETRETYKTPLYTE